MTYKNGSRKVTYVRKMGEEPVNTASREALEDLLAQLVARAWAKDHPGCFETPETPEESRRPDGKL